MGFRPHCQLWRIKKKLENNIKLFLIGWNYNANWNIKRIWLKKDEWMFKAVNKRDVFGMSYPIIVSDVTASRGSNFSNHGRKG